MDSRLHGIYLLSVYNDEEEEDDNLKQHLQMPGALEASSTGYLVSTTASAPERARSGGQSPASTSSPVRRTPSQSLVQLDACKPDILVGNVKAKNPDTLMDEVVGVTANVQNVDPMSKFLPPPPTAKCPKELQDRINKFLAYKRTGTSYNSEMRKKKDYRNPDFLLHAVTSQEINQIGTCFSKEIFNPDGYETSDYYDNIGLRHS